MSRPIYLDHNFTNQQQRELEELGVDVFSPPDWLNPFNFLVRGTVTEPYYINEQYEEAADNERVFLTTEHTVIEHVAKLRDEGDEDAIASNVIVVDDRMYKSFTGSGLNSLVEQFTLPTGTIVHVRPDGIQDISTITGHEAEKYVREVSEAKLADSIQRANEYTDDATDNDSTEATGKNSAERADDFDRNDREYEEQDLSIDEPQEEMSYDEREPEQMEQSV